MKGILVFCNGRPDVALRNGNLLGGLHCGDRFLCRIDGRWKIVRLELSDEWEMIEGNQRSAVPYGAEVEL